MDYQQAVERGGNVVLEGVRNFHLDTILDCGQSFRWEKVSANTYTGIALGRRCTISQQGDRLRFHGMALEEFTSRWRDYFDFGRDYTELKGRLVRDPVLREAVAFCPGMRVLRQDPWEALCTFILSQNNNIPRIKGLVLRLCELLGEPLPVGGNAFPKPRAVAGCVLEDLAPVRAGFRAKYILDAARRVAGGEIDLEALYTAPLGEARKALQTIHGVGPKVADCALLYGLGRVECMPVDVWIGRVLDQWYPAGFPAALEPVAGLAQQYLFHAVRRSPALGEVAAAR